MIQSREQGQLMRLAYPLQHSQIEVVGQFLKTDPPAVSASSDSFNESRAFRQTFIALAMNFK
jgi:hypothetical protein